MKMHDVKPKKYGSGLEAPSKEAREKPVYPTIRINHEHLPEAKDWKVGDKKKIHLEVKMVGNSQSRFQNEGEYELHRLGHDDDSDAAGEESEDNAGKGQGDE